jgi:hypothetical protein
MRPVDVWDVLPENHSVEDQRSSAIGEKVFRLLSVGRVATSQVHVVGLQRSTTICLASPLEHSIAGDYTCIIVES